MQPSGQTRNSITSGEGLSQTGQRERKEKNTPPDFPYYKPAALFPSLVESPLSLTKLLTSGGQKCNTQKHIRKATTKIVITNVKKNINTANVIRTNNIMLKATIHGEE